MIKISSRFSAIAIPFGVPMLIGGPLVSFIGASCLSGGGSGDSKVQCIVVLIGAAIALWGVILTITGGLLILFWLFGGIFVGLWFTFGSPKVISSNDENSF